MYGHWICIAQWLGFIMVEYAYLGKGRVKHPLVWSCVITMLTMTLSVVYNFGFFTPRAVALTILFLFITVMLFGGTPGQKFTACLINGTMCLLVENSMRYVISWILKCELQQVIQRADCLIIIAVANMVVGAAVAFLVGKWRRRNALEPLQALTMSFFPGVVVVLNILLMLTDNNKRATMATMGMTVGLTVAVMVHLCIVAMFNDQVMQRRSLHFQAELEQQRASALLDSYTAQRRLTHEFTNHIGALRALLAQGDVAGAQDYIAGVDKAVAASTTIMDTHNPLLDSILTRKYEEATRQGVSVYFDELGFTQPGMTIVCGDSHTSTHGALGAVAFGVGTSEVEMVFASQCILQTKPRTMRITVDGALRPGVEAKDVILYIISKLTASGGTGHFIEFAGSTIRSLSMEGRMTVCNMSIECGARGGMIAPDEKTFEYLRGRERAPQGAAYDEAVARWRELYSDADAVFDREYRFDAADIAPMISYGTNPGMGMAVDGTIPADADPKALEYMGFRPGERMLGKAVDYVFVGSCTNGRIEDLRRFARLVEGRRKADNITAWIVPGSKGVEAAARAEGLDRILAAAGFELRQPGCSACLAMNADKIPAGKYSVSTSNRNFEGRQGPGARTMLSGVAVAAAAAVTGVISDPREVFDM